MVADKLAVIGADCIQEQTNTDAEAIDETIFFADIAHLLPQFLVLLEHSLPFFGQAGNKLLA